MTTLYRRLGGRYPFVFLAVELHSALLIVAGTLALFSFYYQGTTSEYLMVLAIGLVLTEATIVITLVRVRPQLRPIQAGIDGERDPDTTTRAWASAAGLPILGPTGQGGQVPKRACGATIDAVIPLRENPTATARHKMNWG